MTFQLRCDRCKNALDRPATKPMQVVCLVKAGVGPQIEPLAEEERRRCRGCGFVNIFIPLRGTDVVATL